MGGEKNMHKLSRASGPRTAARRGTFVVAMAALAVSGSATGQAPAPATSPAAPAAAPAAPPMPAAAPVAVFPILGFRITGDNPLGEAAAAAILAPFVRPNATIDTLQQASAALEAEFRKRGYGLHRVVLPPQEVGQTVTLEVVTFTIDKVAIEGRAIYSEANVRRSLPELQEGKTPNFRTLAVQTAIANENPNKQVQVGIKESDEPDKINATITVKEQRPWTLGLSLSNAGSKASGRDRFTVSGGHTNLFDLDHQLVAAYTTSFEQPSDVRQLGLSYKIPLYQFGGVIGASYTRSDVVGNFGAFSSTGAGHTAGINYTHYLPPDGGRRSYVTVALDDKVFEATRINNIVVPGTLDRRSRPITVGYTARTETDAAIWGYNVDFAFNTGSGANNDLVSYQSEDARITTTRWTALRGGFNYLTQFAGTWAWSARAQYQYSSDVLISGEQFGLGGLGTVRGTAIDRPIAGDKGITVGLEVTTPDITEGLRALAFADAGWIGNNSPNGANRPSTDRLASVGVGARYTRGMFGLSVDYGRIIVGSRVPLVFNAAAPQRGDDKLYVNLSVRF